MVHSKMRIEQLRGKSCHGMIIGQGGNIIRAICGVTGTKIVVRREEVHISGTQSEVEHAQRIISKRMIGEYDPDLYLHLGADFGSEERKVSERIYERLYRLAATIIHQTGADIRFLGNCEVHVSCTLKCRPKVRTWILRLTEPVSEIDLMPELRRSAFVAMHKDKADFVELEGTTCVHPACIRCHTCGENMQRLEDLRYSRPG